ncbi:hypothetical protein BH10CYA1_BH10CYA1_45870 [soil metagenome]
MTIKIGTYLNTSLNSVMAAALFASSPAHAKSADPSLEIIGSRSSSTISLSDKHFLVSIQNKTNSSIRIWGENCSWGWGNISFTLRSRGESLTIDRDEINWKKNAPYVTTIKPGETTEREINLKDKTWRWTRALEFCKTHPKVSIAADLHIEKNDNDLQAKELEVWTGSASSANTCKLGL